MKRFFSFFLLALCLLILLNLPKQLNFTLASFFSKNKGAGLPKQEQLQALQKSNYDLVREIEEIRKYLLDEDFFKEVLDKMHEMQGASESKKMQSYFDRRKAEFLLQLKKKLMGVRAGVIFRDPRPMSTGLWIDRGQRDNKRLGMPIICKNSAVVKGDCVVGVIQEVLENKSYVRLITDPSVVVSVRCQRGSMQKRCLIESANCLIKQIKESSIFEEFKMQNPNAIDTLKGIKVAVQGSSLEGLFAKGEICGSKDASFRTTSQLLKGTGFNMEFSDQESEGINLHHKDKNTLLQRGDVLVTTGLDGIFPANLRLGLVEKIEPLKEGAYYYNLEARPYVDFTYDLTHLEVLPPLVD